jgi:uncharacterized protein (TIGR03083 family)
MTVNAIEAIRADRAVLLDICGALTEADWRAASGCPGWSVHDLVTHMAITFWQFVDPSRFPDVSGVPAERMNDVNVEARREWNSDKVLADYENVSLDALELMGTLLGLDLEIPLGDMGTYQAAVLPSAWAFDHYTHIRADLFGPRGPLPGPPPPADEGRIGAALDWIAAALPQQNSLAMPACTLDLEIEGAGARTISFGHGRPAAVISSGADSFIRWVTQRGRWADLDVRAAGDEAALAVARGLRVF